MSQNIEDIAENNYDHAKKSMNYFNMNSIWDSHDLYAQKEALLSIDIFENFRKTFPKRNYLDPSHFYSTPVLQWIGEWKITKKWNRFIRWYKYATNGKKKVYKVEFATTNLREVTRNQEKNKTKTKICHI